MSDEKNTIAGFEVCPRFEGLRDFEPEPIVNHMSNWMPWVAHFKDDPDGDKARLAHMLGYACAEINQLVQRFRKVNEAQAELLFAYIDLVETGKPKPFDPGKTNSIAGAWQSIQVLNQWRKENKLNIKSVDVG